MNKTISLNVGLVKRSFVGKTESVGLQETHTCSPMCRVSML